jgi:hypothetical protein
MELLKQIGISILLIGVGVCGIGWQIFQWRDKDAPRLIYWYGIIPLPIGLVGVLALIAGILEFRKLFH